MATMADVIVAVVGGGGVVAPLGAGARWIYRAINARFVRLETAIDECRDRELASQERRAVHLTVIELLWQEVMRLAPGSPVLARGKKLLDELKAKSLQGEGG